MVQDSERNVRAVEALYDAERRRDIDAWEPLWSPTGRHSFLFNADLSPVVGREALVAATTAKFAERPPYDIGVVTEPLADPSKVLARVSLTAPAIPGRGVQLWCLFHFDDDGLINEIEEIGDTSGDAAT